MKDFLRKKFCKSVKEVNEGLKEYSKTLTAEKCRSYIKNIYKVMPIIIDKRGSWSNM